MGRPTGSLGEQKFCSEEGCYAKHLSRGYCKFHYYRNKSGFKPNLCEMNCGRRAHRLKICAFCRKQMESEPNIVDDNEVRLVLVKWKRNYVDELLYYKTVSLYISIWGYSKDINTIEFNSDQSAFIRYCLRGLKDYLEIRKK